jgi:hypothetical protein
MRYEARKEESAYRGTNPFVFLVGCPRSGTTLLRRIVDAHPRIAITPETHWLPRFCTRGNGCTAEGLVTPALLPRLLAHDRFPDLGIGRAEVERLLGGGGPVPYARFVSGLFDLYGRAQGKPLVGDKTPGYVRKIRTLYALWPGAKFVHLIRDGRDVCLSVRTWKRRDGTTGLGADCPTWADEPVVTAALWWADHVRRGRRRGEKLGPGLYCEVRYEALVARPAEECARLCAFLGVPFDECMLRFHEGRMAAAPGLSAKDAWLPITPGLRDWRTQMPDGDLARFEAAAGPLLDELGYPRAVPHPSAEALGRAAQVAGVFVTRRRARTSACSEP